MFFMQHEFLLSYSVRVLIRAATIHRLCHHVSRYRLLKIPYVSLLFVAVFLGCTSTGWVGLCFLWFFVQELPKAQLAVVLVLKRLRRRSNGLKSHPTDWEKPGIEPATPGLQDIGLSPYYVSRYFSPLQEIEE